MDWHIPLVSALRGQRLPFMNVYDPAGGLFYHFAGDVQAAMLQTLFAAVRTSLSHGLELVFFWSAVIMTAAVLVHVALRSEPLRTQMAETDASLH